MSLEHERNAILSSAWFQLSSFLYFTLLYFTFKGYRFEMFSVAYLGSSCDFIFVSIVLCLGAPISTFLCLYLVKGVPICYCSSGM